MLTLAVILALPPAAHAQYSSPTTSPTRIETVGPPTLTVKPSRETRPPGGLGVTGVDVLGLAAAGIGSVGLGAALVRRSRRRPS